MPYDTYSAMTGGAPTDPARQAALADVLRRQALLGQLGMTSGDRVLAPAGKNLEANAMAGGEQIQSDRERQAAQSQALTFHNAQLAQAKEIADEHNKTLKYGFDKAYARTVDAADIRASALDDKPKKPIPNATYKDLEQFQDAARGVDSALQSLTAMDKAGIDTGGAFRKSKDWIAEKFSGSGLVSPQQQSIQNWDASYGRQFTLPELKATIGIRHNQYMQELFESYHLDPNMTNQQKLTNLQQISQQLHSKLTQRVKDTAAQGYSISGFEEHLDPRADAPPPGSSSPNAAPAGQDAVVSRIAARRALPPGAPVAQPAAQPTPFNMFPQAGQVGHPNVPGPLQGMSLFSGVGGGG